MNIAFFLLPKTEVIYLPLNGTMRQALETMERHRYTAVPVVDEEGRYACTLTEGDLLWKLKDTPGLSFEGTDKIPLKEIPLRFVNEPFPIHAKIQDLFELAISQNFVPVVDDNEKFIGIIRRREIIEFLVKSQKMVATG